MSEKVLSSEHRSSSLPPEASRLIAIATYNEIDNLPSLVEAIHRELPAAHVLVIDDNSPDGTGRWCQEFEPTADWFSVLCREGKLGLGSALQAAIDWATQRDYQQLITLDADWSHPPAALPEMVAASSEADIVIGSRYCPGGSIEGWSWQRRLASRANNWLSRNLLRLPVSDSSGNFRLYDMATLAQLGPTAIQSSGYSFLEEIVWLLHRQDARFAEVPICFTDRVRGASKIGFGEILGKLSTLLRLTSRRWFGRS